MTVTRTSAKKLLRGLLAPHGFSSDGNYFRRTSDNCAQALYLQPSTGAHCYYPEMLVTYHALAPARKNTQADCHLRARLSGFYHPDGDPRASPRHEWTIRYDSSDTSDANLVAELETAIPTFLSWLAEYPTPTVAQEKMKLWSYAFCVSRHNLFQDLGMAVPVPVRV